MSELYSLNHLIAKRVREYPDLQILGIPDKEFNYTKYTTAELDASASLLANHSKNHGFLPGRAKEDSTSRLTVGLLGISNIDYVVTEMALYRMGYCVLFLSPNNSPPTIAHLLAVTNATHIIVQDMLLPSATAALAHLADPASVTIINQPSSEIFSSHARTTNPANTRWDPPLSWKDEFLLPVSVIHSSGFTGYPKPIIATNKAAVGNCKMNFGLTSLTTLPLYHGHGHSNLLRAWYAAKPLYLFPTGSIPLTSANVIKLLAQAPDVQALYGVPLAIKLLTETPEGLDVLRGLRIVTFGGSACPDELGDLLVSEGVRLVSHYGLSDGTYELYVLDGWHTKVMSNQPDGSYASRDLFVKHPTIPDAYKFIGRIDDTLVMVNGEKTNPVPIELTLRSSPYIADAVVFGAARTQIGALILPTEAGEDYSHEEFARRVASVIALANAEAPSHSQLSTEALVFLPYGTVIPRADKGSIIRLRAYKEFEKMIDEVYMRLEGELGSETKRRLEGEDEARVVVRELIGQTIERPIDNLVDDTDLFEFGLDSLQSTRIRNAIQRGVDLGGKKLSSNAVFEHPSITQMAKLIISLSSGKDTDALHRSPQEIMLELVEKYGHFSHMQGVVLTGATGSLGSNILDELLAGPAVEVVYCLCRAKSDEDAANRVAASMKSRKLLRRFSAAGNRVISLAADLPADRLGLEDNIYLEIVNRATLIIHNAWAVNFNLGISSFETHIRGAVNLMNLALSSPHPHPSKFFFASSVSAVASWPGPGDVPEAVTDDPFVAQDMGYAQSKWVTEKLCQIASRTTPMHTGVLRIGQMVGDSLNGIWNETEAISLIFKCADTIGILPELDETVSWLPVDYAAKSIVELLPVCHVLHPIKVPWPSVLSSLRRAGLVFKALPRHEWLRVLRASDPDETRNPSRKLLAFYENKYGGAEEATRYPLTTARTGKASRSIRDAPVPGDELVAKWVGAWRETGFLL
ncbi:hypothetical protein PAXINDRAFT_161353 [Paxillus involutus ATCC 200175]|nr:hypothetical protein PAXINDRAFT_161353 [Paxillus involutus ATCC 200175]